MHPTFQFDQHPFATVPNYSTRLDTIVLVGFMGVGKTVVGKAVADLLGYEFVDTDAVVESCAGMAISEIFTTLGEAEFRTMERRAITDVAAQSHVVIATGGGAPLDSTNASALSSSGIVVHLTADPQTIIDRIGDPTSRPLLSGAADYQIHITSLLRKRLAAYSSIADVELATNNRSPENIAGEVVERVTRLITQVGERSTLRLAVDIPGRTYSIWLSQGLLKSSGGSILSLLPGISSVCFVTHPHLRTKYADPLVHHLQAAGTICSVVTIPTGESNKNLRTVERLYREFAKAGIDRKGLVVAVGGGVIGDIVGFAAASYLRGVRFAQVPTTLLAQVDSSIGGKTGVDLPEGKNLVGAFHQPAVVLIDPDTLITLPARELRSGLAEVIKYGIISDEAFFYQTRDELSVLIRRNPAALARAITRSCEIKARVVCEDEMEQGVRAILNFGHTVGHALESVTQYKRYRHGEAISIGMVTACLIGEELAITPPQVTKEVSDCLAAAGLPTEFPEAIDFASVHHAMMLDKKTLAGKLRFVLIERIGTARIVEDVPPDAVRAAIARQKPS